MSTKGNAKGKLKTLLKTTPYLEYLFHLFLYDLFVRCFAMLCLALSCFWVRQKSVTCNGVLSLGEKGKGVTCNGVLRFVFVGGEVSHVTASCVWGEDATRLTSCTCHYFITCICHDALAAMLFVLCLLHSSLLHMSLLHMHPCRKYIREEGGGEGGKGGVSSCHPGSDPSLLHH